MTGRVAWMLVATALASVLVSRTSWGHTFPPAHTVVAQVEPCELVLLVGYAAGTGEPTERILAQVASQPRAHTAGALRDTLITQAMAPLTVAIDGVAVAPTTVRAKLGVDGTRPMIVVLASYPLREATHVTLRSSQPRRTRMSWRDQASGRVDLAHAPSQERWFTNVASFLLPLAPITATGAAECTARPVRFGTRYGARYDARASHGPRSSPALRSSPP